MPGEKLAKLTAQVVLSRNDAVRGAQTRQFRFTLGGQQLDFYRGGQPGEFIVPDPDEPGVGDQYAMQAMQNVLNLLRGRIFALGLPYEVSVRQLGTTTTYYDSSPEAALIEFTLTATDYGPDKTIGFEWFYGDPVFPGAFKITDQVLNLSPVFATAQVTDATAYGAADGKIVVTASGGTGSYFYTWSDGALGLPTRLNVKAGTYTCTIKDLSTPAYITITCVVKSDARLDVQVQQQANNVQLVTTGGLAPYTYQWKDGPTTDSRQNLASGLYACTVTDSRGVQVTVTVTVKNYNVFYFSRNPVTLALQASDLASKPGLRFLCEVWLEQEYLSGVFTNIAGVLSQPADSLGATVFDVSTLLDAYVQPDFPAHGEVGLRRCDNVFRRFYLQHSEQWDGGGAPTYTVRETHYLVYGGLDFFEYATQSYFTVYRPKVHPFLTWEPVQKDVFADQPEYLYYHHDSLVQEVFQVHVKFTTAAGLTSTVSVLSRPDARCFEVFRLSVGLGQLRALLGNQVPADVVAWEVTVVDAAGLALTETRYYQLSDELPDLRRYFLYANSVGGVNTLATVGKAKTELAMSSVVVQRSLLPTYLAEQGDSYTASAAGVPVLTCNTGYLGAAQLEALQDFLLSEEIRYLDADRYRPGALQPADTVLLQDDDAGLLSVEFAFQLPTRRRHTPTLPLHY